MTNIFMPTVKLFNPEGSDALVDRKMINGNSTNLFQLNNVKFKWSQQMYRVMMGNFWIPEKVDMTMDSLDTCTEAERDAFYGIVSFLTFLDSIQTNNLPNINDYITAPEVKLLLAIQTYQEAIHSQSYQYMIETTIPEIDRDRVYDLWREDNILFIRNKYIANIYQEFVEEKSYENFIKVLIANYLLEGLYFYNGFTFFYNLASKNKMVGSSEIIRYINRDELTHVVIFQNIISEIVGKQYEPMIYEMFEIAVRQEIEWSNHIIGDKILGISKDSIEHYTKHLANRRLRYIGLEDMYPAEESINPYEHLEKIADTIGKGSVKPNFFETTATSYNQSSVIDGWDDV